MKAHAVTVVLTLIALSAPARAAEPVGTWITEGGKSHVRIARCGPALCGTLLSLAEPNDPATGRPRLDKNNPEPSKRSRPVIGIPIVLAMMPSGTPNRWAGRVYNPEDGKTYSGSLTTRGENSLELKGCALAVFCKSQIWSRAR